MTHILQELTAVGCIQTINTEKAEDSIEAEIRFESTRATKKAQDLLTGRQYMGNPIQVIRKQEPTPAGRRKEGTIADDPKEIADCLGRRFAHISSVASRSKEFQDYKTREEKEFDFSTDEELGYNSPITERELNNALREVSDTAPGPDEIHYSMLKNLGKGGKKLLLDLMNRVFDEGRLPDDWKTAYIIPILKEGKDPEETNSYRPIALTSCVCKLQETIINRRFVWFLESNGLLYKGQSGFRRGRSPKDNLVMLETEIHNAMLRNKYLVAVFFDLAKAYDTCWKYTIMKELYDFGLRGKLPLFIKDFMDGRTFRVKVGNTLSDVFEQQMGVPQGSVLSCNLFSVGVNTISRVMNARAPVEMESAVKCSVFVDDIRIAVEAYNPESSSRSLQGYIDEFVKWSDETGFTFSTDKTEVVVFHKTLVGAVNLTLNGVAIKNVAEKKFLGVILDRHLNFISHIAYTRNKALKAMNIMKIVARFNRGCDFKDLLTIYNAFVQPVLDYGCEIYATATPTNLKRLDPVLHQGIRLSLGAYRTSPVESLYAESGLLPLQYRRQMLQLQYYVRSKQLDPETIQTRLDESYYDELYAKNKRKAACLGLVIRRSIEELEMEIPEITRLQESVYGPWQFREPSVCLQMAEMSKAATNPEQYRQCFLAHKHKADIEIYTDGSKSPNGVGSGVVIYEGYRVQKIGRRLQPIASVFTAEMVAIKSALTILTTCTDTLISVYSDSKSSLEAIQGNSKQRLADEIRELLVGLAERNVQVIFCWTPGHVGILGNETADDVAKAAIQRFSISRQPVPVSDAITYVKSKIFHKWKDKWLTLTDNKKLKEVRPSLDIPAPLAGWHRRDASRLVRLRIGHSRITHSYHFAGTELPICIACEVPLTIKHVLMECGNFTPQRQKYYDCRSVNMKRLLNDRDLIKKVLLFLRDIEWYHEL